MPHWDSILTEKIDSRERQETKSLAKDCRVAAGLPEVTIRNDIDICEKIYINENEHFYVKY